MHVRSCYSIGEVDANTCVPSPKICLGLPLIQSCFLNMIQVCRNILGGTISCTCHREHSLPLDGVPEGLHAVCPSALGDAKEVKMRDS